MDEAPYNRMDYDTFMRIAGQFKAGEISADVMWFLLGFGPDHVSDIKEAKTAVVKRKVQIFAAVEPKAGCSYLDRQGHCVPDGFDGRLGSFRVSSFFFAGRLSSLR